MDLSHIIESLRPNAIWGINRKGILIWEDKIQTPPTEIEIAQERERLIKLLPMKKLRIKRDELLRETDVYGLQDFPEGEKKEQWKTYRQALRDLPSNQIPNLDEKNNLIGITFPTPPS